MNSAPLQCSPLTASREEKRRIQARAYEEAWRTWFASLSLVEQTGLRELGMASPIIERPGKRSSGEFDDPAETPQASECFQIGEDDEPLSGADRREIESAFAQALAWAAQASNLVEMGRRLSVMLHIYRPALIQGLAMEIEEELQQDLRETAGDHDAEEIGKLYGCALEWVSRGTSFSQWGQRLMAALYVLRPAAIDDRTLEAIGTLSNKTRQAIDKLVQDFSDTFDGIKSASMRSDDTRQKCRHAQLTRPRRECSKDGEDDGGKYYQAPISVDDRNKIEGAFSQALA